MMNQNCVRIEKDYSSHIFKALASVMRSAETEGVGRCEGGQESVLENMRGIIFFQN